MALENLKSNNILIGKDWNLVVRYHRFYLPHVQQQIENSIYRSSILNWAHRSMDQHTTHKIDHTIYLAIEE